MLPVLIIDDDPSIRAALELLLELHDLRTRTAADPEAALALLAREPIGLVLQDMNFARETTAGREGAALFRRIRAEHADLPVILITAWTSLEMAVQLVKEGAEDYLPKPWDDAALVRKVQDLLARRQAHRDREGERPAPTAVHGLVYASARMAALVRLALQVAPADVPVLITGPNGAGKEKLADLVVANSSRRERPYVRVNAGALPEHLLEAELFGAEAGAFTGAAKRRVGRFEEAHGGTLLLDEVGNLSLSGQAKLLRVLQTGEYQRLGSNQNHFSDARLISATNADLRAAIDQRTFREDLFFRLSVIELAVPGLRERDEDILPLSEHFLRLHGETRPLDPSARAALLAHDWPGNVRELENRVRRAMIVCTGDQVSALDLGLGAPSREDAPDERGLPDPPSGDPERRALEDALIDADGNVSRAAHALGVSRQALYRRMDRLGISLTRRPRS